MTWILKGAAALSLALGCSAAPGEEAARRPEPGTAQAQPGPWVPAQPPSGWLVPTDSVRAILARANLVFEHPRMSGPYPGDVVMLGFAPGSSLDERREAVRVVGGRVVGGDMAHYYVRVRLECPGEVPVWCAVDRLRALPQVHFASPLDIMGYGALPDP